MGFRLYGTLLIVLVAIVSQVVHGTEVCPWSPLQQKSEPTCGIGISPPSKDTEWEGPHNCIGKHCIFSNRQFRGGIVLATTAENAAIVKRMVKEYTPKAEDDTKSPSYYEADIPGKGLGLIANRTIRMGEHIMSNTPAAMMQLRLHNTMPDKYQVGMYNMAVQKLPAPTRRAFRSLVGDTIVDILNKNCFRMDIDGDKEEAHHLGCFLDVARFNHDCRPNIQYHIRNLTITTIAVRDIAPGEELSVSYIDAAMPRAERQERLQWWGFTCACSHCLMPATEVSVSDARITQIVTLRDELDDPQSTAVTAETGRELVALYEAERLDMYLGGARTRAALNLALFGDVEGAREMAARAVEALEREGGTGRADWLSMRQLAEDPEKHWTWGQRRGGGKGRGPKPK